MNRRLKALRGSVSVVRERFAAVTRQSERTVLLATVLLASAVSATAAYVLAQCFSVDMLSSLVFFPEDCWGNWGTNIGRHCFSDYGMVLGAATQPNPWDPYPLIPPNPPIRIGPPAAMLPQLLFGLPAKWLGAPRLGLIGYLFAMTIAVLSPAIWAARGARGLERVVVFVALGAAAIPAWTVIDRGNSAGFVVPIALVFLVGARRRRWGLVAIMVVLAALLKPQFVVLAVVLFAARQWRLGCLTLGGVAMSNLGAYLLWPQYFPESIAQSIHNFSDSSYFSFSMFIDPRNVSLGHALLLFPDTIKLLQTGGKIPDGFLAGPRSLIGYAILIVVVALVLALGRRMPPVIVALVLLATATLFPPLALFYYLVFALPVAALVVRDPDGPPGAGIFDTLATQGDRRRVVGLCVSLAAALSIAQIALPGPISHPDIPGQTVTHGVVGTTVFLTGFLWLIACVVTLVSYVLRPGRPRGGDQLLTREGPPGGAVSTFSSTSEPVTESPPRGPA